MDIKTILNNVKTKGITKTLQIRRERKNGVLSLKKEMQKQNTQLRQTIKKQTKAMEHLQKEAEQMQHRMAILEQVLFRYLTQESTISKEDVTQLYRDSLLEKEPGALKRAMKELFIKNIYPAVYDQRKTEPVEDKVVFLQPRKGLNPSCALLYHTLEQEGKFQVRLYELKRGQISTLEHYENATAFMRDAATARAIVVHESMDYLGHLNIRPETKVIQVWHGCGIIKHLGLSNAGKKGYKSLEGYREFPEYNKYDLVTMAGEGMRWVFEEFMGLPKGDPVLQAIGVSRTDVFFDPDYISACYDKIHRIIPASRKKKIILYAPTYRVQNGRRVAPDALDIAAFAGALSDEYILIIKQHQTAEELPEIPEPYRNTFAYDMTRGMGMNINELMTVADLCISDYSSVIYEFSLFERPILFFMYDMDDYEDRRGMYFSPEELAECGPVFQKNEEMVEYICHVQERFDAAKVTAFKEKYMNACDGHATERIIDYIENGTPRH